MPNYTLEVGLSTDTRMIMLGGQIKVALLNTAQSTSVQYTTGPRPSHLGPCLSCVAPPWPLLRTEIGMLHYLTQNVYSGRAGSRGRYSGRGTVATATYGLQMLNVFVLPECSRIFANGSPNSPQDPHLLTHRTTVTPLTFHSGVQSTPPGPALRSPHSPFRTSRLLYLGSSLARL